MARKRSASAAVKRDAQRREQRVAPESSGVTPPKGAATPMAERRMERARGRRAAVEAHRRRQRIQRIALAVAGVLILAIAGALIYQRATEDDVPVNRITTGIATATDPGQFIPPMSADHVAPGTNVTNYNSDPPTSGDHYPTTARWGISDVEVPDELAVHNLEHGGIIIQYDCPDGCPEVVQQLTEIVSPYPVKLILAPRANMEHMIALTAWNRLLTMDELNVEQVQAFIDAYIDKGPEKIQSETDALRAAGF